MLWNGGGMRLLRDFRLQVLKAFQVQRLNNALDASNSSCKSAEAHSSLAAVLTDATVHKKCYQVVQTAVKQLFFGVITAGILNQLTS